MKELHLKAGILRKPINGTFELTERCNLACNMCYVCHSPGNLLLKKKELPMNRWLEIAQQASDNGMIFLTLTGGEIFLRSDFFNFYLPLTKLGLYITLFTNGTLITDEIANRLADYTPSNISITLYAASEATYTKLTGASGSFIRCYKGIERLLKKNIPIELKTTITKENVSELSAMKKLAYNWGLSLSVGFQLTQRRDGSPSKISNCRLLAKECVAIEKAYSDGQTTWGNKSQTKSSNIFNCSAGRSAFTISPYGEMNACVDLSFPAALPLEIGFQNAWNQVQHFVDSSPSLTPTCIDCDIQSYCSRCPAWSYLETGSLVEPIPYLCSIAQERKQQYK